MYIKNDFLVTNHEQERQEIIDPTDREAAVGLPRVAYSHPIFDSRFIKSAYILALYRHLGNLKV